MTAAGTTSELYIDKDNPNTVLGAPPSAPAPVPQPVKVTEPVVTKSRMADEGPDGRIRDTSGEAQRPGNDLGFRNLTDEEQAKPADEPPPADQKPPEPVAAPAPAPEPKVYAERFKSVEELEKGYLESRKEMQRALAERDELKRQATVQAVTPPAPVQKTAEQIAADQAESNKIVTEFVSNPKGFLDKHYQEATQRTNVALAAQALSEQWKKANPDIAEHEKFVAFEASSLMQADPELAKDPIALFDKATANFRQLTGKFRTEGAKEALTQETRLVPLVSSGTTPEAAGQPPQKTPLTADDSFALHLRMLKGEEQKSHRGLRR
jgi:hypothetical protein